MAVCASSFQGLPLSGGTISGNLAVTGTISGGGTPIMQKVASTPVAGFALQNATPTILTWTAPNDGLLHRVMIVSTMQVTSLETGGAVNYNYTNPGGNADSDPLYPAAQAASPYPLLHPVGITVQANTAVTITQTSALTAGAATMWAEIWAS